MRGTTHVYTAARANNRLPRRVTDGDLRIYGFSLDKDCDTLALAISDPTVPGDLYTQAVSRERRLGHAVTPAPHQPQPQRSPRLRWRSRRSSAFAGADDWELQGWVMRPTTRGPARRCRRSWRFTVARRRCMATASSWSSSCWRRRAMRWCTSNPRGSTGYGRVFSGAVINDWGGKDYEDILAGLDAAIARGGIDERRLGVAGGSYGGFMTNWIVGHTDRFKAGVTMRSVV